MNKSSKQAHRKRAVTVIVIESLSYTGTTWINLILGCHPNAIAIGPADRVRNLRTGNDACRVHGNQCAFWPGFFEIYQPEDNFFLQLADHSGRDFIITNNPAHSGAARDLRHPDIWVKRIRVVRDARGVFASWLRNHPDAKTYRDNPAANPGKAVERFAPNILKEYGRVDPLNTGVLFCKYEDVVANKSTWLKHFSRFVGLDYTDQAFRYWEHDIHPTAGNQGTITLIKFAQNINVAKGYRDRAFYEQQFKRAVSDQPFQTERWLEELTPENRWLLELVCSDYQKVIGYKGENYTQVFIDEMKSKINRGKFGSGKLFSSALNKLENGVFSPPGLALLTQQNTITRLDGRFRSIVRIIFSRLPPKLQRLIKPVLLRLRSALA